MPRRPARPFAAIGIGVLGGLLLSTPVGRAQAESVTTIQPMESETVVPVNSPEYTLPQLVSIALSNNPITRASWADALAAESALGAAKSEYLPTIDFTAVGLAQYFQQPEFPGSGYGRQLLGGPALNLSYLILDFGGRDARVAQAQARMVGQNYQFRQIVQDTLLDVTTSYANVASARATLDAAQAQLAYQELNYASVLTGVSTGLFIDAQELQANAEVEQARAQVQAARSLLASAVGPLNTSLGQAAEDPLRTGKLPQNLPVKQVDQGVDVLIQQALQSRPEIAVAFSEVRVSDERIREIESTYWPTINLDLLGLITPQTASGNALGTQYTVQKPPITAAATITIEWELFDGFYRENAVQEARDKAEAARQRLRQTKLSTIQEVWISYHDYLAATRELLFREAALKAVDAQLEIAEEGSRTGLANDIQLLKAIAMQRTAVAAETQARATWLTTAVKLVYATGQLTPEALR